MHKILVVEESKNLRFLYKLVLSKEGFDVSTVSSKEAALEKLPEMDLVISDLTEPNENGCNYLNHYYKQNDKLKVIINTGFPLKPNQSFHCQADAVLPKTSNVEQLTSLIRNVLT